MERLLFTSALVAVLLATLSLSSGEPPSCDTEHGWFLGNDGHCYFVECSYNGYTFQQARDKCRELNHEADLVAIPDETTQNLVYGFTKNRSCDSMGYYYSKVWIGLQRTCPNDTMKWVTTGYPPSKYKNWQTTPSGDPQICGYMNIANDGKWESTGCDETYTVYGFICSHTATASARAELEKQRASIPMSFCDDGWCFLHETDYCYRTFTGPSLDSTTGAEWSEARDFCMDQGGNLASIHSDRENDFVTQMSNMVPYLKAQIWIGYTMVDNFDHEWGWSDGSYNDYVNWLPDQPDHGNRFGVESCGEVFNKNAKSGWEFTWNDNRCDSKEPFVCKKPSHGFTPEPFTTNKPQTGGCSRNYKYFNGRCFLMSYSPKNFTDAIAHCKQHPNGAVPGHLTSVRNIFEQSFLLSLLSAESKPAPAYIGIYAGSDGHVFWANEDRLTFTHWDGTFQSGEGCGYITPGSSYWQWLPWERCGNTSMHFICEAGLSSHYQTPAPPTFSSCPTSPKTPPKSVCTTWNRAFIEGYDEAERNCKVLPGNGHLASFTSATEWATAVAEAYAQGIVTFWIGLRRRNSGDFTYEDGWPVGQAPWADNEPNNRYHCVYAELDQNSELGIVLKTADCGIHFSYLCKAGQGPAPTVKVKGTCPGNYLEASDACYRVHNDEVKDAADAYVACVQGSSSNEGRLAGFATAADFKFFMSQSLDFQQTKDRLYIGLQKASSEASWAYEGTAATYQPWGPNEPNEAIAHSGDKLCAVTDNRGLWYVSSCDAQHYFICELDKGKYTSTSTTTPTTTSGVSGNSKTTSKTASTSPGTRTTTPAGNMSTTTATAAALKPGVIALVLLLPLSFYSFLSQ